MKTDNPQVDPLSLGTSIEPTDAARRAAAPTARAPAGDAARFAGLLDRPAQPAGDVLEDAMALLRKGAAFGAGPLPGAPRGARLADRGDSGETAGAVANTSVAESAGPDAQPALPQPTGPAQSAHPAQRAQAGHQQAASRWSARSAAEEPAAGALEPLPAREDAAADALQPATPHALAPRTPRRPERHTHAATPVDTTLRTGPTVNPAAAVAGMGSTTDAARSPGPAGAAGASAAADAQDAAPKRAAPGFFAPRTARAPEPRGREQAAPVAAGALTAGTTAGAATLRGDARAPTGAEPDPTISATESIVSAASPAGAPRGSLNAPAAPSHAALNAPVVATSAAPNAPAAASSAALNATRTTAAEGRAGANAPQSSTEADLAGGAHAARTMHSAPGVARADRPARTSLATPLRTPADDAAPLPDAQIDTAASRPARPSSASAAADTVNSAALDEPAAATEADASAQPTSYGTTQPAPVLTPRQMQARALKRKALGLDGGPPGQHRKESRPDNLRAQAADNKSPALDAANIAPTLAQQIAPRAEVPLDAPRDERRPPMVPARIVHITSDAANPAVQAQAIPVDSIQVQSALPAFTPFRAPDVAPLPSPEPSSSREVDSLEAEAVQAELVEMPGAPPTPVRRQREERVAEQIGAQIQAQEVHIAAVNVPESLPLEVLKAL